MDGAKVTIKGREFVVPPMSIWASERMDKPENYASPRAMCEMIRDMLLENYPDLSTEDVMKMLPAQRKRLEVVFKAVIAAAMTDVEPATGEAVSP